MGNYEVPVYYLLTHLFPSDEVLKPPTITSKTIELGTKYSPDFVCTPFKYTLGTFLECLEKDANILIQNGGGCRYGYYFELQEKILKDLGYDFKMINLVTAGHADIKDVWKSLRKINSKINPFKAIYYTMITSCMIRYMDKMDCYIRENIGFEDKKGSFEKVLNKMLKSFSHTKGFIDLYKKYHFYLNEMKDIPITKPENPYKVGIIGELYTIMEPFSNYDLEKKLANMNIEVKRFTNVTYLLFLKKHFVKKYLRSAQKYVKHKMGADAMDNIARAKYLCEKDYDGILHIKSSFCTPEIGAMPIIRKVCQDYQVPVLFFSFDSSTSEVGIQTRLEAFYDMLEMRRKK